MAFNLGTPKSATGFTLPTSAASAISATPQFNLGGGGGGDLNIAQSKPLSLFSTPLLGTTAAASTSIAPTFNISGTTTAAGTSSGFVLGTAAPPPKFSIGGSLTANTVAPTLSFGAAATSSTASTGSLGILGAVAPTTATTSLSFGALPSATTTVATAGFSLGGLTTTSALLTAVTSSASALPATGSLTFSQLEDAINKWTVDLEEQGKVFGNQAKHLNAWDRLLISNGEKILGVSNGIERIKQQQQQLDQELDFVLAQQKELEDCIVPLEKELEDIPVTDMDRDQTYKLAENIDAQLKQMSEDLKEIIEHLNESNKAQELSDPVAQIGRILNAHMNSLQWIDRNTSQIGAHLDEIAKMHDLNRRNENIHGA